MSNAEMQTCFCLEELTESKVNLKRLTAALNEQYPIYLSYKGTGSDSEYSAIAALHITATDLWSEFPKILHSLAEYDDEQLYATALKLSDAVKRFDFLKRGNYSALIIHVFLLFINLLYYNQAVLFCRSQGFALL